MATPAAILQQQFEATKAANDQGLIQQGLAAGQPQQIQRAPSLFDQVSTGLFSTGVADPSAANRLQEQIGGPFGQGLFGGKGRRAVAEFRQEQFDTAKQGFFDQVDAAGIDLTAADRELIDTQLAGPGGFEGAQQIVQQIAADLPQAVAVRQQATQTATLQRQAAVTTEARNIVGLNNDRLRTQQITLETANAEEANLRSQRQTLITNRSNFQSDVRQNAALSRGQQAITSFQQLNNLLLNPDATALDIQNGMVALAQILEPGLAVRNDDRIAIMGGATPGLVRLVQDFNQFVSGDPDLTITRENMVASARQIIAPRATEFANAVRFYENEIIPNTPGVKQGATLRLLGLDPTMLNTIMQLEEIDQQQRQAEFRTPNVELAPLPGQGLRNLGQL